MAGCVSFGISLNACLKKRLAQVEALASGNCAPATNIALRSKNKIQCARSSEQTIGNPEASKSLTKNFRAPWKLRYATKENGT